jgi:hypothetical protein
MSENQIHTDDVESTFDKQAHLLDELQDLLEKLLHMARRGDSTSEQFGVLTSKAGSLMEEIERTGILDLTELQYLREELRKRYENLCLIIATQKANMCRELNQARRCRKILGTYRSNI